MSIDLTVNRCNRPTCERVARWTNDDGARWWCKDHRVGGSVYVMAEKPVEVVREGTLIGSCSLKVRVKK